jgi:hypothetical protein
MNSFSKFELHSWTTVLVAFLGQFTSPISPCALSALLCRHGKADRTLSGYPRWTFFVFVTLNLILAAEMVEGGPRYQPRTTQSAPHHSTTDPFGTSYRRPDAI